MYLWSTKTSHTNKLSPGLKIDLQFLFTNGNNKWSASFISRTPPVSRFHFVVRENFIFHFRTLSIRSLCMHPRLYQHNSTTNTHTHTHIQTNSIEWSKREHKKWMNEKINTLLIYLPWFDSHSFISSFFRVYIIIVHISLFIMWTKMNIKRVKISSVLHTVKENANNKKA